MLRAVIAADADACFCDGAIVATVEAIIGAEGLDFFRRLRGDGVRANAAGAGRGTCPRPVTTLQQVPGGEDDYDDGEGFAGTTPLGVVPAFSRPVPERSVHSAQGDDVSEEEEEEEEEDFAGVPHPPPVLARTRRGG